MERYKASLVAKGFTQKEGIGFKETFSPVSTKDSFKTLMALVAHFNLEHQMDVNTAFLNGDIGETIYMVQPENFESRPKEYGLQIDKVHLWIQASFLSVVPQVSSSDYLVWF